MVYPRKGKRIIFQFHKGTIRTWFAKHRKIDELYFNSIKVQLELEFVADNYHIFRNFNSIKVQLERGDGAERIQVP